MKKTASVIALMMGVAINSVSVQASDTVKENPWQQMARMDLDAIHDALLDSHMGPIDKDNREFNDWLTGGLSQAKEMLVKVDDFNDYNAVMRFYVDGFNDSHLSYWTDVLPRNTFWPKMILGYSAGKMVVKYTELAEGQGPAVGAALVSCDGTDADALFEQNVLPYYGVDKLEATKAWYAPRLLFSENDAFRPRAQSCTFEMGGKASEFSLNWAPIKGDKHSELREKHAGNEVGDFELAEISSDVFRISVPTFHMDSAEKLGAIKALIADVAKRKDELQAAKAIVFDVRGNTGGYSVWGDQILKAIWGDDVLTSAWRKSYSGIEFRASEANYENDKRTLAYVKQHMSNNVDALEGMNKRVAKFEKAIAEGKKTFTLGGETFSGDSMSVIKPDLYFFSDYSCASSCLDFADSILSAPTAKHYGLPTQADAVYIDNRQTRLPSNMSNLSLSIKVYRDRNRGHNQPYIPSVRYDSDDLSTKAIDAWMLDKIN